MSFQDQIIEAAMNLSQEGDSVEVFPDVIKPKQFKCAKKAHQALKQDGISVTWDSRRGCAVVCKGTPAPAPAPVPEPAPAPEPEEKGQAVFDRFAGWDKDATKED